MKVTLVCFMVLGTNFQHRLVSGGRAPGTVAPATATYVATVKPGQQPTLATPGVATPVPARTPASTTTTRPTSTAATTARTSGPTGTATTNSTAQPGVPDNGPAFTTTTDVSSTSSSVATTAQNAGDLWFDCWDAWSRCSTWSYWMWGVLWLNCNDKCKELGKAGGNCTGSKRTCFGIEFEGTICVCFG